MSQSKTVRWGVIGLGWFGEIHVDTLAGMPAVEVAAVCTRRPERLAEVADRYQVAARYTDYRALLADDSVDAVSITTHVYDHRAVAVAALEAGKKVFLEKTTWPPAEQRRSNLWAGRGRPGDLHGGGINRLLPRSAPGQNGGYRGGHGQNLPREAPPKL